MKRHMLWAHASCAIAIIVSISPLLAQTTAGEGTTVVFPVTAQTASFASEVTVFNPNAGTLVANVSFYEADSSSTPGAHSCSPISVPANRSLQFSLSGVCTLAAGSHFGLVVITDTAPAPGNPFYGYTRVQNPAGIGFSVEGFPAGNFNNQVSHSTGLKRQAASPTYQTNCFVGTLEQPANYELRLFNDSTGAQIGTTLTGALAAFEQLRYLDIFGPSGVNAPAGDQFNVRAQFTQTIGTTGASGVTPRYPKNINNQPSTWEVFTLMTWRDKRLMAVSQAGLVEKFVDALVWVFYPVFLFRHGVSVSNIGWIVGVYGFVWGGAQFFTGKLSDHVGRHLLNVWGMWLCGAGVGLMLVYDNVLWWSMSAGLSGLGMALLYPNLSAAVADTPELARLGHWNLSLLA